MHDLRTRALIVRYAVPGALSIAIDTDSHVAYVGTAAGEILAFDTDVPADDAGTTAPVARAPAPLAAAGAPVERLWAMGDGDYLVGGDAGGGLVTIDADGGIELSRTTVDGRAEVVDAGRVDRPRRHARRGAGPGRRRSRARRIVGGDEAAYRDRLEQDLPSAVVTPATSRPTARRSTPRSRTARWPGSPCEDVPRVAVADAAGVTFLEPATGTTTEAVPARRSRDEARGR